MNETHTSVLSAFCDGEPVDPDAFAAALADSLAREALVAFVRVRRAVQTGPEQMLPASLAVMRRPHRPVWRMSIPLPAVAALLLVVLLGAWMVLPRPAAPSAPSSDTPPTPTRVVKYVPGVDWQNH
ncbi:MAG: hypothetical protein A3H96_27495 [Acidobacteria bacterium RIFCSPLOWO2_02_FULL_67_36]|nr:MAG: hypothetical protein A3H96_27495 [Acidobacteria bacterium RIFCSPLOWO2_02_FULL_67_36]OFW26412.1 MAG: hypothetical protein A3G21_27420 [Acidobacteria bacterium RIFCSPLOWO2_12_FULL_66_21]